MRHGGNPRHGRGRGRPPHQFWTPIGGQFCRPIDRQCPALAAGDGLRRHYNAAGLRAPPGERLEILAELVSECAQIAFEPHVSGWLSIAAMYCGQEVFRAWLDRPFEEYELWPEGATIPGGRTIDSPGRIGKRRNWINLTAAAWPQLARFANAAGIVAAIEAEAPMVERPDGP